MQILILAHMADKELKLEKEIQKVQILNLLRFIHVILFLVMNDY